jgi:tight adherence protein B
MLAINQDSITLILFGLILFCVLGLLLVGVWIYRNRNLTKKGGRVSRFVGSELNEEQDESEEKRPVWSREGVGKFRDWINQTLKALSSQKLQKKISSAYWQITDTEFILIRVTGIVLSFALFWLIFGSILAGIFIAVVAAMLPSILLDWAISQRQKKFHKQLLDILVLIKGAVQAGYGLMQALDLAIKEVPEPAAEEFGRVLREIRLGISLQDALTNLVDRMENDDLQIVVTAIIINSEVGGNLSTVLEATISTIRDRIQLQAEILSLTSYSRYVGNFLTLLPFIAGVVVFSLMPDYFETLRSSLLTQIIFVVALLGVIIGNFWIRRLVRVKV